MADETSNRDTQDDISAPAETDRPVAVEIVPDPAPTPEVEPEPQPEPAVQAPAPVAPARGPGAGSMIIGGVLAAGIGAAAALAILPEGWRQGGSGLESRLAVVEARPAGLTQSALQAALAPLEARLAALESADPAAGLEARVTALETRSGPDLAPLESRLSALEAAPGGLNAADIEAAVAPLTTRIAQIEADIAAQARAAVDTALAHARAQVDAQAQALAAREDTVDQAQARIAARTALAELVAASESGDPAAEALSVLNANDPALTPFADGLVTLAALQDSFAPAARAALAADAPGADAPLGDRVLNFLRSQTGARSLAPREGDDTDAVLSRAEAAVRTGDLGTALNELATLQGAPAEALSDWRAQAETRLAALAALSALQDQMARNED